MTMKKITLALAVAATMGMSTSALAKDRLALVISTLNNPFFVTLKEGAEKKADELGYDLVVLDSQNDPAKELSNVEDVTVSGDKGVKVLLINPADSDAVGNAVMVANKKGIPVITLDRGAKSGEVISHIASDNVAGGQLAGDFLAEKLGDKAKIIELEGLAGTSAARERGEGFAKAVEAHQFEVLAKQPADFDRTKGLNVMENLLTAQPEVKGVFAHNDEMALGALRAVQASGKKVMIVGFDGTDDGIAAIKAGLMAATVAQQPSLIGEVGIETADQIIKGKAVEKKIDIPLRLIIEENVEK